MKILAGLNNALCHGSFSLLQVGAGVVDGLVSNLALNLQHARVVGEHVIHYGAGESVLSIGIDIHLDDAVAQGFLNLFLLGAGAAVENKVEELFALGKS